MMFNALTQHVRLGGEQLAEVIKLWLRIAGVLAGAILVFMALYFFVASLEVPVIHKRIGVSGRPASAFDQTATGAHPLETMGSV